VSAIGLALFVFAVGARSCSACVEDAQDANCADAIVMFCGDVSADPAVECLGIWFGGAGDDAVCARVEVEQDVFVGAGLVGVYFDGKPVIFTKWESVRVPEDVREEAFVVFAMIAAEHINMLRAAVCHGERVLLVAVSIRAISWQ
jgi:hypothetical protein